MTADAAFAEALQLETLPVTGVTRDCLAPLDLPAAVLQRCEPYGGVQVRAAILARREGRVVGLALTVRRPLTAYLKLAELWVEAALPDAPLVEKALLVAAEELARAEGAVVIKRALAATDEAAWRSSLQQGYQPLPAPAGPGPALQDPASVPRGLAKWLAPGSNGAVAPSAIPYYRQTTDFTCGPVSLAMAMAALGPAEAPARPAEITLWREATTIVAPAGPGGCDTFGLALAARRRGFAPRVHISQAGPILLERAKTDQARDLVRFVQQAFRDEAAASDLPVTYGHFTLEDLHRVLDEGGLAIVLIDQDVMHVDSCPHWILVHEFRDGVFLAHDPWTDTHLGESWVDAQDLPLPPASLERIARYGDPSYRSMLVLNRA